MDEIYSKIKIELTNQLKSAYKKYKNSIYYDNYSSIQRLKLSEFENENNLNEDDSFFEGVAIAIIECENFNEIIEKICKEIDVIAFPKEMCKDKSTNKKIIRNYNISNDKIDRLYYFIDLPVLGHILGVLWILRCGYALDDKLYDNCYGNRLNENLLERLKNRKSEYYTKNQKLDLTHSLFKPYYKNYESWRDNGLDIVNTLLKNKKHAIMISMDLKEFYYRSLIDFNELKQDLTDTFNHIDDKYNTNEEIWNLRIDKLLTKFIENVFKTYTSNFNRIFNTKPLDNEIIYHDEYLMIPLGFLPSLIISNWYLQGLDQVIVEDIQPSYYGRYVDDILIVLGTYEKSESHGMQQIDELTNSQLIKKYLTPHTYPKVKLFEIDEISNEKTNYRIHDQCFKNAKGNPIKYIYDNLEIHEDKFLTYYFSYDYSDAIIQNFKEQIRKNSSEFRLMHDLESIKKNFRENLYKINYKESINKLRDIENVNVNKFEISKILSRLNWVSSDTTDEIDDELVLYLIGAFKGDIFEFITLWEKIFSMLLINEKYDELCNLIEYIQNKIDKLEFDYDLTGSFSYHLINEKDIDIVKKSLKCFLKSCLIRVFSLKNNKKIMDIIETCYNEDFNKLISNYLNASMQNNSLMKYPIRDVTSAAKRLVEDEKYEFDLINGHEDNGTYYGKYYPRFVKLHECILDYVDVEINSKNDVDITFENGKQSKVTSIYPWINYDFSVNKLDDYFLYAFEDYIKINFGTESQTFTDIKSECELNCPEESCPLNKYKKLKNLKIIKTPGEKKDKLKIGLLNTKLHSKNFENKLLGKPNLTSERFDRIKLLINEAIKKKIDLLVMPEMYVPYEWVEKIVKISKDHQMAIIFGVEPVENNNEIANYIMSALPFILHDKYYECALVYRLKNYYAPNEIKQIKECGKQLKLNEDNIEKYYMYIWKGIHIVPYYCYEISSIEDRSLFKSCCDIITVSEFNKDTKYFDNIAESLSRDLFCYCIKSNTSEYGGSSIIQPSPSEEKYLVKLKGGADDYLVTYDLNIGKLKKSAKKIDGYSNSNFKPKPAGYCHDIVKKR